MRKREEYLNDFEGQLLGKLSDCHKSLNRNLIYSFSLMFVFILFSLNLLTETSIAGNKIKLTQDELLILMPLLIILPYFLVNNSIRNIARIVKNLKSNSVEIITLNPDSRPFDVQDLEFQSQGIASLQFQLSKWIINKYLSNQKFSLTVEMPKGKSTIKKIWFTIQLPFKFFFQLYPFGIRLMSILVWIMLLVLLYILPLIVGIVILFKMKIDPLIIGHNSIIDYVNYYTVLAVLLLSMIVYTLMSNLVLYLLYFTELAKLKENISKNAMNTTIKGIKLVLALYKTDPEK